MDQKTADPPVFSQADLILIILIILTIIGCSPVLP